MNTPNLDRVLALADLDAEAAEDGLDSLLSQLSHEEQRDLLETVDKHVELLRWVRAHLARATDKTANDDEPLAEMDGAIEFYHVAIVVREMVKHLGDAGHSNTNIGKSLLALAAGLAVEDEVPKEAFLGTAEQCFRVATGEARKLHG